MLERDAGMRLLHSSQSYFFTLSGEVNSRIMLKTTAWHFFYLPPFLKIFGFIFWLFGVGQQISWQASLRG